MSAAASDWVNSSPQEDLHYYTKCEGDTSHFMSQFVLVQLFNSISLQLQTMRCYN
jgi:hypothetical protein